MALFAHHAEAFFQIEIMGQPFPDGPTEHAIAFGAVALALALMLYGAIAVVRDVLRWRRRQAVSAGSPR